MDRKCVKVKTNPDINSDGKTYIYVSKGSEKQLNFCTKYDWMRKNKKKKNGRGTQGATTKSVTGRRYNYCCKMYLTVDDE